MNVYVFLLAIIIIIILLKKLKIKKIIYLKKLILPVACAIFILCLVIYSKTSVSAAIKGIDLCLRIVFPSLFPFFVGSEILYRTGIIKALGTLFEPIMRPLFNVPGCGSFAFVMGISSGYPLGAKITSGMRLSDLLTKTEAERLIAFTNNSGPLFIIGAVAVGMFNNPNLGILLLACHIAACISVGIIFRFYKREKNLERNNSSKNIFIRLKDDLRDSLKNSYNLGEILGESIKSSINTLLSIGGFIIFFSVLINILLDSNAISFITDYLAFFFMPLGLSKELITSLCCGALEITTGTSMASRALNMPAYLQLSVVSMIIGWAGISVHSQVLSIISSSDIGIKPYLFGKLLQSILAGVYTYVIVKLASSFMWHTVPTYAPPVHQEDKSWDIYLFNSIKYFIILNISLILFGILLTFYRRLKNSLLL